MTASQNVLCGGFLPLQRNVRVSSYKGKEEGVHWLRLHAYNTGGTGYVKKTKILHDVKSSQKEKKKREGSRCG